MECLIIVSIVRNTLSGSQEQLRFVVLDIFPQWLIQLYFCIGYNAELSCIVEQGEG